MSKSDPSNVFDAFKGAAASSMVAPVKEGLLGKLPVNQIIQFPTGRWGFVGRVHADLAYTMKDGSHVTPEAVRKIREFGPALAGVKTRSYDSKGDAMSAAMRMGYEVTESRILKEAYLDWHPAPWADPKYDPDAEHLEAVKDDLVARVAPMLDGWWAWEVLDTDIDAIIGGGEARTQKEAMRKAGDIVDLAIYYGPKIAQGLTSE